MVMSAKLLVRGKGAGQLLLKYPSQAGSRAARAGWAAMMRVVQGIKNGGLVLPIAQLKRASCWAGQALASKDVGRADY